VIGKTLGKIAFALLGGTTALAAVVPPGLYWLGLSNIEGRPEPPSNVGNVAADRAVLQEDLRMHDPIVVEVLNPWSFFTAIFQFHEKAKSNRAVGIVAGYYNSSHLKSHRILWWSLSEASLMIWLTRHWTPDEIVTAAATLARSHPNPSNQN
jgi:hypothetical protein